MLFRTIYFAQPELLFRTGTVVRRWRLFLQQKTACIRTQIIPVPAESFSGTIPPYRPDYNRSGCCRTRRLITKRYMPHHRPCMSKYAVPGLNAGCCVSFSDRTGATSGATAVQLMPIRGSFHMSPPSSSGW